MQKINNNKASKITKEKPKNGKGKIHIRDKKNGKEARTTIQLGLKGIKNPRVERYGETEEIAVKKIREVELDILVEVRNLMKITQGNYLADFYKNELDTFNKNVEKIVKQKKSFSMKDGIFSSELSSDKYETNCQYPVSMFIHKMIQKKKKEADSGPRIDFENVTFSYGKSCSSPNFGAKDFDEKNTPEPDREPVLKNFPLHRPKFQIQLLQGL